MILSFVPDPEQRLWRKLTRSKQQLMPNRVRLHSQVESLLEDAKIKLWGQVPPHTPKNDIAGIVTPFEGV
jgi:hypothetical protein